MQSKVHENFSEWSFLDLLAGQHRTQTRNQSLSLDQPVMVPLVWSQARSLYWSIFNYPPNRCKLRLSKEMGRLVKYNFELYLPMHAAPGESSTQAKEGRAGAWMMVDLGANRRLELNHYCLRHAGVPSKTKSHSIKVYVAHMCMCSQMHTFPLRAHRGAVWLWVKAS